MTNEDQFGQAAQTRDVSGLVDLALVFDALDKRDDAKIWAAARATRSHTDFFELVRNEAAFTRHTTRHPLHNRHSICHHSALVMMPMVLPPRAASLIAKRSAYADAIEQIIRWVGEWWENKVEVRVFDRPIGYAEVAEWTPSVMREKLDQLAMRREPTLTVYESVEILLPPEAPSLAFLVAAVQQPIDPPELPAMNPLGDHALTSRFAGVLQMGTPGTGFEQIDVMVPAFASDAICKGLIAWIRALAACGISQWDATPVHDNTVRLQLTIGDALPLSTSIPLHAHQLGLHGLSAVLEAVKEVSYDCSNEIAVEQRKRARLN